MSADRDVVAVRTVDDVVDAVRRAVRDGLEVDVRGGGHGAWGALPGGLTIDLASLDGVTVSGGLAHVGGGATWGAVAAALADAGVAISSGDTTSVGVGGLTLGGGIGWMVRAWGLAADQLVSVQLVTAAGEVVEADDASHPDLLWGLRGGGGNFGVVTRFDFRTHALPAVVFATYEVTGDARPVLRSLRDLMADAPRALTTTYMDVPPMDPSAPAGATITACWIGDDRDAARAVLAPLGALDGVTERETAVTRYVDILLDAPDVEPDGPTPGFVGGNMLVADLSDARIDALVRFRETHDASVLFLRSLGGAFGDVSQEATPFPARDAQWFAMAGAFDLPGLLPDDERAAAEAEWAQIERGAEGAYGNFTTSTDPSWAARIYRGAVRERLVALKRVWDPGNVFARNHNIDPR